MPKGTKPASKSAANIQKLDSLGSNKNDFEEAKDILGKIASDFIKRVRQNLQSSDLVVSGSTSSSLNIVETDKGLNIVANASLMYIDKGVSGTEVKYNTPFAYSDKMPPPRVFAEWIRKKNLVLRDNKKYGGKESPHKHLTEDERIEQAAFGMALNHKKKGQKPMNVYSKEIEQMREEVKKQFKGFAVNEFIKGIKS